MSENQLNNIWNWLLAFKTVAETQHLGKASKKLFVTSPALSRTISLLEESLKVKLFNRVGRNLVLSSQGEHLLKSVTQASIGIQKSLKTLKSDPFSGPIRVGSLGVVTQEFVLPALLDLQKKYSKLIPELRNLRTHEANQALEKGEIDFAFYYEALTHEKLIVEKVGETSASIYCGSNHPAFNQEFDNLNQLLDYPFSVPAIGDTGQVMDGWPADISRKIGMKIFLLESNLRICLKGQFLTVLPDATAKPFMENNLLRKFPFKIIPNIPVYAAFRKSELNNPITILLKEKVIQNINKI